MSSQIGRSDQSDFGGFDAPDFEPETAPAAADASIAAGSTGEIEPPVVGPGAEEEEGALATGALSNASVVPMRRIPGSPGDLPDPELPKSAVGGFYATWKADVYVNDVSPQDPAQGQLGDCFLVSAMSAAALTDPAQLKSRIADHGDGTYTVRLTEKAEDGSVKDVPVKVDADFIVDPGSFPAGTDTSTMTGAMPADVRLLNVRSKDSGEKTEIWPTLVEKAYAKWKGGYEAINNGGHMHESLTAITGHDTKYGYTSASADEVWKDLSTAVREKRPTLASTKFPTESAVDAGYVPGHAYTVLDAKEHDGKKLITLRNPWGSGEPGNDGKDDGVFEVTVQEFQKNYGVYISTTGKPPQKVTPQRDAFAGWNSGGG